VIPSIIIDHICSKETYGLRKEIPDLVVKEGSKVGHIVLDRKELEDFLQMPLRKTSVAILYQKRKYIS